MPELEKKTIKNEEGEEIEVYDVEQVEATLKEKEESFGTEKEKLEADLKEKEEALAKSSGKDKDFEGLRKAKESAESKLKEAEEKHKQEIDEVKGGQLKEKKEKTLDVFSDGDADVKEKMKHTMENELKAMPESTQEEIDKKMEAAYRIVVGANADEDKINQIVSSAGGGEVESTGKVSSELKKLGQNFGLTDKDWKAAENAGEI